jgi:hypothetical protein
MAIDNFIPEIWTARILSANDKALVYGSVVNRDYEGEISGFGDTVHINEIGDVTIATYTKNSTSISPETLTDAQRSLLINQSKYFAFEVDDIDKAQQKPKVMNEAMRKAGYGLRDNADAYIASLHGEAGIVSSLGTTTTPIEITSANVLDYISLISQKMNEANISSVGRWMVAPPFFFHKINLAKIDLQTPNQELITNGHMGKVFGIDMYMSNNVVNTSSAKYKILAGNREAISFAQQILSVEAYRPEASFSDAVKGLMVYGAKVVKASNLVCLTANNGTES